MLGFFKKIRKEINTNECLMKIAELEKFASHFSKETEGEKEYSLSAHDMFYDKIKTIQFNNSCNYSEAIVTDEGRDAALELLLHYQYVGYLFESIRIERVKLFKLEHGYSPLGVSVYRNEIELKSGMPYMNSRLDRFIKILPHLITNIEDD